MIQGFFFVLKRFLRRSNKTNLNRGIDQLSFVAQLTSQ
jgi:hypothetical protein